MCVLFSMSFLNCSGQTEWVNYDSGDAGDAGDDADACRFEAYAVLEPGFRIQLNIAQLDANGVQKYPYACKGACIIFCPQENLACETKAICLGYTQVILTYTYPSCNY